MLVLKRRINQSLVLDTKDGRVIIDVRREEQDSLWTVRLGIRAPESVKVWRGEIAPRAKL